MTVLKINVVGEDHAENADHIDWKDNLVGKSFSHYLSHPPIDIVYTWVNGSDPRQITGAPLRFLWPPLVVGTFLRQGPSGAPRSYLSSPNVTIFFLALTRAKLEILEGKNMTGSRSIFSFWPS